MSFLPKDTKKRYKEIYISNKNLKKMTFFCILKIFPDAMEKVEILACKTCKIQESLLKI